MPSLPVKMASADIVQGGSCRLLDLPVELQLSVYELVVPKNEVLLLNFPCNSSYRRRFDDMRKDREAWQSGEKHPPTQPAITQTCRFIRNATLPMFYGNNVFRAGYCKVTDDFRPGAMLPPVIHWLDRIGSRNREMLRHLYFYDRNERQDVQSRLALRMLMDCEVFTMMGGMMESIYADNFCAHWVTFGSNAREPGDVALARQFGIQALLTEDESVKP